VGKLSNLKNEISGMDSDRGKVKDTLPCHKEEQQDECKQTDKDEDDETLHIQFEELQDEECDLETMICEVRKVS